MVQIALRRGSNGHEKFFEVDHSVAVLIERIKRISIDRADVLGNTMINVSLLAIIIRFTVRIEQLVGFDKLRLVQFSTGTITHEALEHVPMTTVASCRVERTACHSRISTMRDRIGRVCFDRDLTFFRVLRIGEEKSDF